MSHILKYLKNVKGQAMTEYVIIIAFVGLVLSIAAFDLFEGTKGNYYQGMLPLSKGQEIPPPPKGNPTNESKKKPEAIINAPERGYVGQEITFKDESVDPDGRIVYTSWGTQTLKKTFDEEGTFVIHLTVVDNDGLKDTVSFSISIGNEPPTAVIKTTPDSNMSKSTPLKVDGSLSRDPEGDNLKEWEWYMTTPSQGRKQMDWPLDGTTISSEELEVGKYTFELKVMDVSGEWSEIVLKTVEVVNQKPTAIITMTPSTEIDTETKITWAYDKSTDPDGDQIVEAEWDNKLESYPSGNQTVRLRVKDAAGMWSDWAIKTFTVKDFVPLVQKFNYTGNVQSFTIPSDGKYKLEVWGAQGGKIGSDEATGGKGAYVTGTYTGKKGTVLYLYVGGKGGDSSTSIDGYYGLNSNGGWNGGGKGSGSRGPGGGGASDIRLSNNTTYADRILVAGGGGGGYVTSVDTHGGYTSNLNSYPYGQNGGTGTYGSDGQWNSDNGGGGGGYLGGKTIYGDDPSRGYGGSSYIGAGLLNTQAIAGDQSMPSPNSGNMSGNSGHGVIVITRVP